MDGRTRRLAAVLFADIVGFTRLSSQDEAAALRLVDLFQDVARRQVEGHGGTLVKFMGDGALAYAASTAGAVDAAVALIAEFHERSGASSRPAQLRIGIHVGDIALSEDGDVYGDGVNVAARLQGQARPGEIIVSEDVWRQCKQRPELEFTSLGPTQLKGVDEQLWTYQLVHGSEEAAAQPEASAADDRDVRSLAVLPFEVMGASEEVGFLAAGLHNDLLTELTKIPELTVISRTSVMGYDGTDKPMRQIARELGVGTIVEGAVQSAGSRVRLTVQLIDAQQDIHKWAESYDRELTTEDLFEIQTEVAERIAESLHAELATSRDSQAPGPPTDDLDAYRLHAQGRMELELRTEASLERAVDYFDRATKSHPDYVLAWVGLSDALAAQDDYGYGDRSVWLPRAEGAARRALELDPNSAEAHASLGLIYSAQRDGPAANKELARAIELRPGYADAHAWMSWLQQRIGEADQALLSAKQAVILNPLSAAPVVNLALSLLATGDAEGALGEARRAGELSPFTTAKFYEGLALYHLGRFDEAERLFSPLSRAVSGEIGVPWAGLGPDASLALNHVASGDRKAARQILTDIELSNDVFAAGLVHVALDEPDEAFESFARVGSLGAWPCLAVHHLYRGTWDLVRDDPRLGKLVAQAFRSWKLEPDP